ncbi:DUF1127 domain-containing protein [Phreatobacter cathodiphilus]|uniref:YjiS-like domain-containing protein n=1 Tax=Phreatobacter cathodiphilus TaxID=1868589 RepID=A0A2S0NDU2_9HYPH|nr:DUF1127 domain-containing protein [Phreatobacter cathodiphilus]AVO46206.1 hypothetical protein C6569_14685 [Phreatobacter cathodiphilus]
MPMFAATLSSAVLSVVAVVRRQIVAFRNWREAREGYAALCEMDERTLHDLGLTRSDLRDATAAGYFGDPTQVIAARAGERQGRRPGIATTRQLSGPPLVPDVGAALSRTVPSM